MTPRRHGFGSATARAKSATLQKRRTAARALHRWQNRELTIEEQQTFARIKTWIEHGASLSTALLNADVTESQFCAMVGELKAGRNSTFASNMEAC